MELPVVIASIAILAAVTSSAIAAPDKPNVILILGDDMGIDSVVARWVLRNRVQGSGDVARAVAFVFDPGNAAEIARIEAQGEAALLPPTEKK